MIKRRRAPKKANLSGLYAVNSDIAYDKNKKLKSGVYGIVAKDTPYIFKRINKKDGTLQRVFVNDMTNIPDICKNRIMAFWDDKSNNKKTKSYLVDKSIYDEYMKNKKK